MSANPKFLAATAQVDQAAIQPLPKSRKIYIEGSRADLRVPMREITQSETPASFGAETNPPFAVYDTSGPYTDPAVDDRFSLRALPAARALDRGAWRHRSSSPIPRRLRRRMRLTIRSSPTCASIAARRPRRARSRRQCHADALRAARHRHARDGVHRDSREPAARRAAAKAAARASTRASRSARRCRSSSRPNSCATKSRAAARSFRPTSITRKPSR